MTESDHTTHNDIPEKIEYLDTENLDIPKWQLRHLKKRLLEEVEVEAEKLKEAELVEEPDSQIQELIKETYQSLKNMDSIDEFDCFYENSELKSYSRMDLYAEFIEELLEKFQLTNNWEREELESEEVEKALFKIAEAVGEEPDGIEAVKKVIKDKYPTLVKEEQGMTAEEYKSKQEKWVEKELIRAVKGLEPAEDFKQKFEEFRELNNNEIEDIAVKLDQIIDVGVDVWKLVLYSVLSPHSNNIKLNDREIRSSLHTLFIGEISTGKSGICGIAHQISPQSEKVTGMTKASFEGSYNNKDDKIEDGVIDRIRHGNLIMEEYDKINLSDGSLMRTVFDNSDLQIEKGNDKKKFDEVPTSIIAGANPKKDFFIQDTNIRDQVPFKEGELSRFDITIPMVNTAEDTARIVDEMTIFGGKTDLNMDEVAQVMEQLATRVAQVTEMEFEETPDDQPSLEQELKQAFKALQTTLETKNRQELLIARDFEILVRLVNIIGCINEEILDGKITVSQETVSKAVSQFETLIDLRERLYLSDNREKVSVNQKDRILEEIVKLTNQGETVRQDKVKEKCLDEGVVNNKATFYNKMEELVNEEKVWRDPDKDRYKEVKPLAQTSNEVTN
jgi:DNA replicative helicase MCM subunit Mcm2 (Cdc46/Mcm family)